MTIGSRTMSTLVLGACGSDSPTTGASGGGAAKAGPVKFGINEAKGSGPAYDRLAAMADAYTKKTGASVSLNAVDHNTFQESITTYLQGTPDDVFTWFAGYRMAQFAEGGTARGLFDGVGPGHYREHAAQIREWRAGTR